MLKLIIVGSGQVVSSTHLPNLMQLRDRVEVAGLVDLQLDRAKELAAKYGIPEYSTSYLELAQKIKPDAALVTVPNLYHAQTCIDLLQRGIHVFCEKPPATNGLDALRMEQTALENQKLLTYGFHFRFSKDVAFLHQKIVSGEFGNVYHQNIRWLRRRGIPGWGSFTNKAIQGGGPLIDLGIHLLDVGLYFLGDLKPTAVLATQSDLIGKRGGYGLMGAWDGDKFTVEDGHFSLIRFENGSSISLSTSYALNTSEANERQISIYGDKLGAELFPLKVFGESGDQQFTSQYLAEEDEENHLKCIRNFLNAVEGKEPLLVTASQGTRVQTLVDALYFSAETGKAVDLH